MIEFTNKPEIIRNSAKCRLCGDEIESRYRWECAVCKCGEIFIDGGKDYIRRGARNPENLIDTSLPQKEVRKPRILFWDVETSLNILTSFSLFPKFISHNNILQDWYIICGSWKFLGDGIVNSAHTMQGADDYEVVKKLRDALLEADIIVHHNGDKFDIKKLNTRLIYHRLDPLPTKLTTVDTLKSARRTFAFTSNRLDYLGKYLGVGEKIVTDPDLWMKVLAGDEKAIQDMVVYNQRDVELLENVYGVMRPYIKHPYIASFAANDDRVNCNHCGSASIRYGGWNRSKAGWKRRFQCKNCAKWDHEKDVTIRDELRVI